MTGKRAEWWLRALEYGGIDELIRGQDCVVSRQQWLLGGGSLAEIRRYLRADWRTMFPGVYLTDPGGGTRFGLAVGALLYAGEGAMWSHATAAEQWGLRHHMDSERVDVLIAAHRRVRRQNCVCLHSCASAESRRAPFVVPPRVTPAHAVLDLVNNCRTLDSALAVVADSCQTARVDLDDVLVAMDVRHVRWCRELRAASGYLRGSESLLEVRYVRDVEIAHGLPRSTRQRVAGGEIADCSYDAFRVLVELDGRMHLASQRRFRDMRRDNRSALRGEATLRYGFIDVTQSACDVAVQVLVLLRTRGFTGPVRACGPGCPVR